MNRSWGPIGTAGVALVGLSLAAPAWAQEATVASPWTVGVIASMLALSLGGFSAVLGMWVTRDTQRPIIFAVLMTVLIGTAVFVGVTQSYLDAVDGVQKQADLDRMMGMVKEIAIQTGDTELAALIEAEGGGKVEMPEPEPEVVEEAPAEDGEAAEGEEGMDAAGAEAGEEAGEAANDEAPTGEE